MSVFASIPHELHRKRRAALNNFFSKASVRQIEPTVRDIVVQLLNRMDICGRSGEILPLNMIFKAVTSDIITRYSFGKSTNYVTREDYNRAYFEIFENTYPFVHLFFQFGWIAPIMSSLPIAVAVRLMPGIASLFKLRLVNLAT